MVRAGAGLGGDWLNHVQRAVPALHAVQSCHACWDIVMDMRSAKGAGWHFSWIGSPSHTHHLSPHCNSPNPPRHTPAQNPTPHPTLTRPPTPPLPALLQEMCLCRATTRAACSSETPCPPPPARPASPPAPPCAAARPRPAPRARQVGTCLASHGVFEKNFYMHARLGGAAAASGVPVPAAAVCSLETFPAKRGRPTSSVTCV